MQGRMISETFLVYLHVTAKSPKLTQGVLGNYIIRPYLQDYYLLTSFVT